MVFALTITSLAFACGPQPPTPPPCPNCSSNNTNNNIHNNNINIKNHNRNTNNNRNNATGVGIGVGIGKGGNSVAYGGRGGSASANAAVKNSGNSSVDGSGNSSNTYIDEDKREHIQGPALLQPDAKLKDGKALAIKTFGLDYFFKHAKYLSYTEAQRLAENADDVEVKVDLFKEFNQTGGVQLALSEPAGGQFMGFIYLTPTGDDCTMASLIGKAAAEASLKGGQVIVPVAKDTAAVSNGSAWNVGIGGGASILRDGDKVAIAPNGGTGYGKAKAWNEKRPALMVAVYGNGSIASATPDENKKLRVSKLETSNASYSDSDIR